METQQSAPPVSTGETAARRRLARGRGVLLAAGAMILAQLGFRAWAVLGSWYRFDDANFMSKLMADGVSTRLLFHGFAGHLMPGAYLLTDLNLRIDPFSFTYPAVELLVLQALASLGALVFLVSAFGRRPGILAPLAVFLTSAISLPAYVSWGPGVTQLPFLAAVFWGGWTHLTYLRTRRFRWALATMVITLVAIGFGEKSLLVFWVYAVLALGWFASGDIVSRLRQVATRYRAGVILYGVIALGYGAAYLAVGFNVSPDDATSRQNLASLLGHLVADSWATGILGGPLRWRWVEGLSAGLADPGQVVAMVALLLLGVLGYELARTRERASRAWWLVIVVLASDLALIATTRSTFVGPDVALASRYLTETAAVSAMALGLATLPLRGAVETVAPRRRSAFLDEPRRVAIAVLAVAVLGTYSAASYAIHWHQDNRTERYFANARHDLDAAHAPVPIADTPVPTWMIWGLAYPDNLVSHALTALADRMSFPQVATNNLYVIDQDGHLRPMVVDPVRRAVPRASAGCAYPVAAGTVTIPLDGPAIGSGWWVHLSYAATSAGTMHVTAGDASYDVHVQAGLHSLFFAAQGDRFQQVTLTQVSPGSATCVSGLELGQPQAYEGRSTR